MGALDRFLRRGRQQDGGYKPLMKRLEAAMLAACRAAGASAWYVPDDFLELGPELVVDASFDSPAAWTLSAGVNIVSGSVMMTAGNFGNARQNVALNADKYYLVSSVCDSRSAGAYAVAFFGGTTVYGASRSATGSYTEILQAKAGNTNLRITGMSASDTLSVSSVSIREILSAKDFQDSAGTLPSYLGGTVGLLYDGTGTVSNELVPDPEFNAPSKWTTQAGYSVSSGKVVASAAAQSSYVRSTDNVVVAGKTYEFTITCAMCTSGQFRLMTEGLVTVISSQSTAGKFRAVATPTTTGRVLIYSANATPLNAEFESVSVKEITGNHVTQATAGNRPLVSRIPRQSGPELVTNGTFDADASWTKGTGWSISGGLATKAAGVAENLDQVVNLSGKNVAVSFTVSGRTAGTVSALLVESGVGTSTLGSASANGIFTFIGARPTTGVFRINSDSVFDGSIDNISVREVLEWSNALTCDGSNDSLATVASVIGVTLTQPYTMIAWGRVGALGAARRIVGDSARSLGVNTTGKPYATNHGVVNSNAATTMVAGQLVILESTWDSAALAVYVNGVKDGEIASAAPTAPAGATTIGQRGSGTEYWNEAIGGVIVCPAVMTDAQRLAVRKFAAAQMGMTL